MLENYLYQAKLSCLPNRYDQNCCVFATGFSRTVSHNFKSVFWIARTDLLLQFIVLTELIRFAGCSRPPQPSTPVLNSPIDPAVAEMRKLPLIEPDCPKKLLD